MNKELNHSINQSVGFKKDWFVKAKMWSGLILIVAIYMALQSFPLALLLSPKSQQTSIWTAWGTGWGYLLVALTIVQPVNENAPSVSLKELLDQSGFARFLHAKLTLIVAAVVAILVSQIGLNELNNLVFSQSQTVNNQRLHLLLTQPEVSAMVLIVGVILGPITEEFIFRRYMFDYVLAGQSVSAKITISSFFFAMIHVNSTPISYAIYMISGAILGWLFVRTGSLKSSIAAHMIVNVLSLL